MISIIIPTYNREKTIYRSVMSVLNQTYKDLEVVIIDDCSSDRTEEMIKALQKKDNRIRYYRLDKNSGACAARNIGIDLAKGEYIAFQDSDDEWLPQKLEVQMKKMLSNKACISFCKFKRFSSKGIEIFPNLTEGFISRRDLLRESIISTQTILGKKECFENIRFDPQMPRMQDYDIVIRLSEKYHFYFIDEVLLSMYLQNDSISMNWDKLRIALERISLKYGSVMKKYRDMNYFQKQYLALSKEKTGRNSVKERMCCFVLHPSWETTKKAIKAMLLSIKRGF